MIKKILALTLTFILFATPLMKSINAAEVSNNSESVSEQISENEIISLDSLKAILIYYRK